MIYITKTIDGKTWQLQDLNGLEVEVGSTQISKLDEPRKFRIQGGTHHINPQALVEFLAAGLASTKMMAK